MNLGYWVQLRSSIFFLLTAKCPQLSGKVIQCIHSVFIRRSPLLSPRTVYNPAEKNLGEALSTTEKNIPHGKRGCNGFKGSIRKGKGAPREE